MDTKKVKEQLLEMVQLVVTQFEPEKVILFGSFASNTAKNNSDVDLFIVKDSELPRYKRSVPLYKLLANFGCSKDILVYTNEEVEKYKNIQNSFVHDVLQNGKVMYEK